MAHEEMLAYALSQVGVPYQWSGSESFDCTEEVARYVAATTPDVPYPVFVPDLVTIPNIEIIEVGEDWETSTGVFTWDEEDLVSAIESQDDPAVRTPVVKLGHIDPRFDGQPSFGRIENLRLANNSQTLIGDFVGVPRWLATIMPTAFPRRSFEGLVGSSTRTGNTWPLVVTAVSLLGVAYPAINTLEDLQLLWSATVPELVPAEDDFFEVAATQGKDVIYARKVEGEPMKTKWRRQPDDASAEVTATAVQATVSLDDLRNAFYDSLNPAQMWWWVRQILINPLQLVVDDDEGGLWIFEATVGTDDTVTFGDPTAVKVEYVAAAKAGSAIARPGQLIAASFADVSASGARPRATVPPTEGGAESSATEEEQHDMQISPEVLTALGLAADASEADVNAAIAARLAASAATSGPETPSGDEPAGDTPEGDAPEGDKPEGDVAPETGGNPSITGEQLPVAASIPAGMRLVDDAAWQEVMAGARDGQRIAAEQATAHRDNFIAAAVKAGKFPRASMPQYVTLWDNEVKATGKAAVVTDLINKMSPGLIPVTEVGDAGDTDPVVQAAYPEQWKKSIVKARSGVSTASPVKVAND